METINIGVIKSQNYDADFKSVDKNSKKVKAENFTHIT